MACLVDCRLLYTCKLTSHRPIMLMYKYKAWRYLVFYMYASINRGEYHVYINAADIYVIAHEIERIPVSLLFLFADDGLLYERA